MAKTTRTSASSAGGRDIRALLHAPQHDLQAQLASRLERLGFPALRASQVQILTTILTWPEGVRLSDLVAAVSLPKQTVGDMIDELETMKLVERFQDPEHGVIKRVRLGAKGKVWAAEVKRVSSEMEAKWATRIGSRKMKSLRTLLEELATSFEAAPPGETNGVRKR
jgi:DNA-binding MarR family transcriptional regulator